MSLYPQKKFGSHIKLGIPKDIPEHVWAKISEEAIKQSDEITRRFEKIQPTPEKMRQIVCAPSNIVWKLKT